MRHGRRSIAGLAALAAGAGAAIAVAVGGSAAASTQTLGPFTVTDTVTQDTTAGTTTVTYVISPDTPKAQFDATLADCSIPGVVSISKNGKIWPDEDPSTGVQGPLIRWPANNNNKPGDTLVYSYTVQGLFDATDQTIAVKSKNHVYEGTAKGIGCTQSTTTTPTGTDTTPTGTDTTPTGTSSTPSAPSTVGTPGTAGSQGGSQTVAGTRCIDKRKFRFGLHKFRKAHIVAVDVFVNGRKKLHRTGHDLRSVAIKRLPLGTFTIKIVSQQDTGSTLTSVRRYNQCRKGKPKTRAHHAHRNSRR